MKINARFYLNRIALISFAAFIFAGGVAKADDTTKSQTDTPKKQTAAAKDADKNARVIADSASKLNLSKLQFYGVATVGYEATFGKTTCAGKNVSQNGMYSQVMVGTDFKLTKDITMSVQVGAGHYPNGFGFR